MARGKFFPYEHDDELIIADESFCSIELQPGAKVTATRELEPDALPFRPRFIDVMDPDWEIWSFLIGFVPQFPGILDGDLGVPAEVFSPLTTAHFKIDTIAPGQRVTLVACNMADRPRKLRARLIGHEVVPRDHPAHATLEALHRAVRGEPLKGKN